MKTKSAAFRGYRNSRKQGRSLRLCGMMRLLLGELQFVLRVEAFSLYCFPSCPPPAVKALWTMCESPAFICFTSFLFPAVNNSCYPKIELPRDGGGFVQRLRQVCHSPSHSLLDLMEPSLFFLV